MAVPIIAAAGLIVRAAKSGWSFWIGVSVLMAATAFSGGMFADQLASSAIRLWPIMMLAGFFIVVREIVRQHYKSKRRSE